MGCVARTVMDVAIFIRAAWRHRVRGVRDVHDPESSGAFESSRGSNGVDEVLPLVRDDVMRAAEPVVPGRQVVVDREDSRAAAVGFEELAQLYQHQSFLLV